MVRKTMIILAATSFVGAMVDATAADAQWGGYYGYPSYGYGNYPSYAYGYPGYAYGGYPGYAYGGYPGYSDGYSDYGDDDENTNERRLGPITRPLGPRARQHPQQQRVERARTRQRQQQRQVERQ